MLFILTGDVQTGKTRWLQALVGDLEAAGCPCAGVVAPGDWRSLPPGEDGCPRFEKLGIDNELLPGHERVRFARRRDLARAEGAYDAASQSARAKLGWAIDDAAIERVNAHFAMLAAETGACAAQAGSCSADAGASVAEGGRLRAPGASGAGSARPEAPARGGLLVVDEIGKLELRHGVGLTEAARMLDAGPTGRYPVALVVVRDRLAPLAQARFAPAWGCPALVGPDEKAREALFSALGVRLVSSRGPRTARAMPPQSAIMSPCLTSRRGRPRGKGSSMIDKKAFRSLSYGLYVVGAAADGVRAGCVVNTFAQVTSTPAQVSVAINKENFTTGVIRAAGRFTAVVLDEETPLELIGTFGFHTSADTDKFGAWQSAQDGAGMPYLAEHAAARFSARVVSELDLGTHVLFVGEVTEAASAAGGAPMTYAYYHQVKGGKTPPKASSYEGPAEPAAGAAEQPAEDASGAVEQPEAEGAPAGAAPARVGWRCMLCGYIEWVDELSDDFVCPICGAGKVMFERIEE